MTEVEKVTKPSNPHSYCLDSNKYLVTNLTFNYGSTLAKKIMPDFNMAEGLNHEVNMFKTIC